MRRRSFLSCLAAGASTVALPAEARTVPSLAAAHRRALAAIEEDPAPTQLAANFNFVASNEEHLDRFRAAAIPAGGIHVGVGTEQNYVLAGWQRPDILVLMDFDRRVVDVHRLYALAFAEADTAQGLLTLFSTKHQGPMRRLIEDRCAKDEARRLTYLLQHGVARIETRLRWMVRHGAELPSFMTERRHYDYIRGLFAAGRVRALRGDLTGAKTLTGIQRFAGTIGSTVRTLYVSNAEEYFQYDPQTRKNFLGLPSDDDSTVLRTTYPGGEDFLYLSQKTKAFQAWLRRDDIRVIGDMLRRTPYLREARNRLYDVPGPVAT